MKKGHLDAFLIGQTATAVEAMQKIDFNAKGILFVVDGTGRLAGVITDGDIRRWLIKTGDLREEVSKYLFVICWFPVGYKICFAKLPPAFKLFINMAYQILAYFFIIS